MTAPWETSTITGTWLDEAGAMVVGKYEISVPVRLADADGSVIIPHGSIRGDLATVEGSPSLSVQVPATDDPNLSPAGWKLGVEITFTGAYAEKYNALDAPAGQTVDLSTVMLPSSAPSQAALMVRGVPGGVAGLNANGDVTDATGAVVGESNASVAVTDNGDGTLTFTY